MEIKDKVSIIVPVYKTLPYIKKCVSSLTSQTYKNLEIILVDDGSPDGSGVLCDELAKEDDRILVLHQSNKGVSAARNHGLAVATGEWIAFCDSDDQYEQPFVEKMLSCAYENKADFVVCNYKILNSYGMVANNNRLKNLSNSKKSMIALGPVASGVHLIKHSLFIKANVQYPVDRKVSEELPVIPVLVKYAEKIAVLDEPLYIYVQRGDGTSASNTLYGIEDSKACWEEMNSLLGREYVQESEYHAIYTFLYGGVLQMCRAKKTSVEIKQMVETFEKQFPSYRSNPYMKQMGKVKVLLLQLAHLHWFIMVKVMAWGHRKLIN